MTDDTSTLLVYGIGGLAFVVVYVGENGMTEGLVYPILFSILALIAGIQDLRPARRRGRAVAS